MDVPLLLGLEFLDSFMMTIDLAKNKLTAQDGSWEIPLIRKGGHLISYGILTRFCCLWKGNPSCSSSLFASRVAETLRHREEGETRGEHQ